MATVITPETVQARYPGLMDYSNSESVDVLTLAIEDAGLDIDEDLWDEWFSRGMCALAAHLTTERLPAGEEGAQGSMDAINSVSADGVTTSFTVPSDIPPQLARYYSTSYGRTFVELMQRLFAGAHIV